jgi:hypothetical protein
MDEIEHLARRSVSRASWLAMATIAIMMLATAYDPHLCASVGGFGLLLLTFGLVLRALVSHRIDPRDTEVWGLINPSPRKRQQCRAHVAEAMKLAALRCAKDTAALAAWCFAAALGFSAFT